MALLDLYPLSPSRDATHHTRFVYEQACVRADVATKRALVQQCIQLVADPGVPTVRKTYALRVMVNPMLVMEASTERVMTPELVQALAVQVWRQVQHGAGVYGDDELRVELLQMSTLVLEHSADLLASESTTKMDAIKFGWSFLPLEDVTVKHAAYLLISRFLQRFESPLKITGQVYVCLLYTSPSPRDS